MDIRDLNPTANQTYLACICWLLEKTKDPNLFYFLQNASYMRCKKTGMFFQFEIQRGIFKNKKYVRPKITMSSLWVTYSIPEGLCKYKVLGLEHVKGKVYRQIPEEIWEYIVKWSKK